MYDLEWQKKKNQLYNCKMEIDFTDTIIMIRNHLVFNSDYLSLLWTAGPVLVIL